MEKLVFNPIEGTFDLISQNVFKYDSTSLFPLIGEREALYLTGDTGQLYFFNGGYIPVQPDVSSISLDVVTDVGNVTNNNITVSKPFVGSTSMVGGGVTNTEATTNNSSLLSSLFLQVQNLINGFRTRLLFPVTPTQNNNITLPNNSGTIALLSDIVIPPPLTPEQIQDSAFAILTDTPTIDLTYDDVGNQVRAEVIDNSIDNIKASDMPANSMKVNSTNATGNPQDINVLPDSNIGRVAELNGGNLTNIPYLKILVGQVTLNNGTANIFDSKITTSSIAFYTASNIGVLSSVPLRVSVIAGQATFSNGQLGDNAVINFIIYF